MIKELVKLNLRRLIIMLLLFWLFQVLVFGIRPKEVTYFIFITFTIGIIVISRQVLEINHASFFNIIPVTKEEILKSEIITLCLVYMIQLIIYISSLLLGYKSPNIYILILISIIIFFYIIFCIYSIYIKIKYLIDWIPFILFIVIDKCINKFQIENYIKIQNYIIFTLAILSLIGIYFFKKYFYKKLMYSVFKGEMKENI